MFTYAPDGYSVLSETQHALIGSTTVSNTTETVYLPTASGPMPVVAPINGAPFAVYADHLNTPRRLTDAQGRPRWQWAFSGFGEQAAQSIPRNGLPTIRYPGQRRSIAKGFCALIERNMRSASDRFQHIG